MIKPPLWPWIKFLSSGSQASQRRSLLIAVTFQSHGQRNLGGYTLCGHKDLDMN